MDLLFPDTGNTILRGTGLRQTWAQTMRVRAPPTQRTQKRIPHFPGRTIREFLSSYSYLQILLMPWLRPPFRLSMSHHLLHFVESDPLSIKLAQEDRGMRVTQKREVGWVCHERMTWPMMPTHYQHSLPHTLPSSRPDRILGHSYGTIGKLYHSPYESSSIRCRKLYVCHSVGWTIVMAEALAL